MPAPEAEFTAISKLGRFFRLSEVHLWDDSYEAFASDTGYTGSQTAKTRNKPPKPIDEDHSTVEDLELANLMCSLGLPVSFSTSKEKKRTPNRGKKKGRQAPHEAENAAMDDARTSANTEEIESTSELMVHVEHTDSCNASSIETSVYVEKSGCGTTCSDEIVLGDEAENQCEHDNMSTPINSDSLVQENQAVDIVMQLNKEMSRRNSVENESGISCHELYQEGRLSIVENQISGETPSISHDNNDVDHQSCLSQEESSPVDNLVQKSGSDIYYEFGDWKVLWDLFYSRYYFYNSLTQESTWYPPQGLEDFASYGNACTSEGLDGTGSQETIAPVQEHSKSNQKFDQSSGVLSCANNSMDDYITDDVVQYGAHLSTSDHGKEIFDQAGNGRNLDEQGHDSYSVLHNLSDFPNGEPINQSVITTIDEAQHAENLQNYTSMPEVLEVYQEVAGIEKKKRVRRSQSYHSCEGLDGYVSNGIAKYWIQRYSLFSLFDSGVKMDEEGWFSVTPELIAKHHASRVGAGIVIDCFTGVGGNAIQFATKCKHVVAVDIDPQKIGCTRHNATVYGVNDNIDFIVGDFIQIAPRLKGETAFMSPPWGGPDYAKVDVYDMKTMLMPCDGYSLFKLATKIAPRVVMFLPRNIDLNQLAEICLSVDPPWAVEVEKNFLNGKLKAITAYFQEQDGSDVQCC